ncbi:MAG TPA: aldo/keto reductase [Bryobacteraceae bacterium]|nr:aldo/keto reductase [Bryobacteraceae bacterium]
MQTRLLGRSGICVPRLGLGCATFGREIDQAASFAIMDYALEQGICLFDTAEAYGGGQARDYRKAAFQVDDVREVSGEHHSSEKIIGRWLRSTGARERIVLVSKVSSNFTRRHVREALQASLERLQTDYLDVYLFHSFDPSSPLEEALEAMAEARQAGLIRCAGCSNFSGAQLRDALETARHRGLPRLEVTEANCNLAAREAEADLLPLCREQQIGFLGYSPLGAGFLTGKYAGGRAALPPGSRFHVIPGHADVYFHERNFRVVEDLHRTAAQCGVPAARLAIAWVLAHPDVTSVLCGARNISHLENALAAARLELPATWPAELHPA